MKDPTAAHVFSVDGNVRSRSCHQLDRAPSVAQAHQMFEQMSSWLRPGSTIISVLPSLDTTYHIFALERRHGVSPSRLGRVEPRTGIYTDVYGEREKSFTPQEIHQITRANGLAIERLEKIRYPWKLMRASGWDYYPRSPRVWDWYLVASRN